MSLDKQNTVAAVGNLAAGCLAVVDTAVVDIVDTVVADIEEIDTVVGRPLKNSENSPSPPARS